MILLLAPIVGLIVYGYRAIRGYEESGFPAMISAFGVAFASLIVAAIISFSADEKYVDIDTAPLLSLDRGHEVSGSFIFGCGSVNERPVFFFYEHWNDGEHLTHYSTDNVTIREDTIPPQITEQRCAFANPTVAFLCGGFERCRLHYVATIPPNSIKRQFNP